MTALLNRRIEVSFMPYGGGTQITVTNLQMTFDVSRTLEKSPSKAAISIYNLTDDTVNEIRAQKNSEVTLKAGYGPSNSVITDLQTIFVGDVRTLTQRQEGPNRVLEVEAGDGNNASREWAHKFFKSGAKLEDVIAYLANKAGLKLNKKNLSQTLDDSRSQNQQNGHYSIPLDIKTGLHVRGYAVDELNEICLSHQLEFSIQNNELRITPDDENTGTAPKLTPQSGLIGSPVIYKKQDRDHLAGKGADIVRAKCLLVDGLLPGSEVEIDSKYVKGSFRVLTADYSGSLYGASPLTIDFEGKGIKP